MSAIKLDMQRINDGHIQAATHYQTAADLHLAAAKYHEVGSHNAAEHAAHEAQSIARHALQDEAFISKQYKRSNRKTNS